MTFGAELVLPMEAVAVIDGATGVAGRSVDGKGEEEVHFVATQITEESLASTSLCIV